MTQEENRGFIGYIDDRILDIQNEVKKITKELDILLNIIEDYKNLN